MKPARGGFDARMVSFPRRAVRTEARWFGDEEILISFHGQKARSENAMTGRRPRSNTLWPSRNLQ